MTRVIKKAQEQLDRITLYNERPTREQWIELLTDVIHEGEKLLRERDILEDLYLIAEGYKKEDLLQVTQKDLHLV
jgi:hypothetical protein